MLKKPAADPEYISAIGCKRISKNLCTICGRLIREKDFKDKISKQEYSIAGTCQKCQDRVYDSC